MKRIVQNIGAIALCAGLWMTLPAPAAASPDSAERIVKEAIGTEVAAQKENEAWQAERASILEDMRQLQNENMWLSFQQKKYSRYVTEMEGKVAELERTQAELDRMENELEPYLYELVEGFTAFVESDLPFLKEERARRVAFLQATLDDHELALGEKLRRIFEALEIEASYGQTAEVTSGLVSLDGRDAHVSLVRAGRLGLYCLTPDERSAGRYDAASGEFRTIPGKYVTSIVHLRNMAKLKRFTELVALPVEEVKE